jgi:transaldolase
MINYAQEKRSDGQISDEVRGFFLWFYLKNALSNHHLRRVQMNYLQKVQSQTKTRYWINNPSRAECAEAIRQGAHSCTTNPAYCSKLFQSDPEFILQAVKDAVAGGKSGQPLDEQVYHAVAKVIMGMYLPVYEMSGGKKGFVTIQESPILEEDFEYILAASLRASKLGRNYMAKVPVTEPGLKVIKALVAHNIPICATEIFTLSQAKQLILVYDEAAGRTNNHPPLYITHITGIMDQYFSELAKKEDIRIPPQALEFAGTAIAKAQYRLLERMGHAGEMLGGGARGTQHFTNFVGGDLHVTINWSTAVELNEKFSDYREEIDQPLPEGMIRELTQKLPNFARAYDEDAMKPEEFAYFGPVMLFRTQFMNGYSRLIDAIRIQQAENARAGD